MVGPQTIQSDFTKLSQIGKPRGSASTTSVPPSLVVRGGQPNRARQQRRRGPSSPTSGVQYQGGDGNLRSARRVDQRNVVTCGPMWATGPPERGPRLRLRRARPAYWSSRPNGDLSAGDSPVGVLALATPPTLARPSSSPTSSPTCRSNSAGSAVWSISATACTADARTTLRRHLGWRPSTTSHHHQHRQRPVRSAQHECLSCPCTSLSPGWSSSGAVANSIFLTNFQGNPSGSVRTRSFGDLPESTSW